MPGTNGKQNVIDNDLLDGLDPDLKKFMFQQAALSRSMLAGRLGTQFGGNRDLYATFGYLQEPTVGDYKNLYERQGLATRAVEKFSNDTWNQPAVLIDGEHRSDVIEKGTSKFIRDWAELNERVRIWNVLREADIMCGFGRFSLIFLGSPGKSYADPAGNKVLSYLAAYDESQVGIDKYIQDTKNPDYGMPEFYTVSFNNDGTMVENPAGSRVHYSRVIHVAEDKIGSRVFGRPRLKRIINRLFDLEKVTGGGAEAAWLAVFKGMLFLAKDGAQLPAKDSEAGRHLDEQINKLMHRIQRYATLEDVEVHDLGVQEVNIRNIFDVLTDDLAGSLGIPKRILFGSERGELASSQDKVEWNGVINSRRTNFAEPDILRPFIKWCITHKVITPPSSGGFKIEWADVYPMTKSEKADYSLKLAQGAQTVTGGVPEMAYDVNEWRADNDLPARSDEELAELEEKQAGAGGPQDGIEGNTDGEEGTPPDKPGGGERSPFMDRDSLDSPEGKSVRRQAGRFIRRQHLGPGNHPSGSSQDVHGRDGEEEEELPVPGFVKGKLKNIGNRYNGRPVYQVEKIHTDDLEMFSNVAVAITGKNKGTVLIADSTTGHSAMVDVLDYYDNVDSWVRMNGRYSEKNGGFFLEAYVEYAGVTKTYTDDDEFEIDALNNIYDAYDVLKRKGIPSDLTVIAYKNVGEIRINRRGPVAVLASVLRRLVKRQHLGPGNHPSGSSQDVHGKDGGGKVGGSYDRIASEVADDLDFDKKKLVFYLEPGKQMIVGGRHFTTVGEFYRETGEVAIYAPQNMSEELLRGTVAHEIMHSKFNDWAESIDKAEWAKAVNRTYIEDGENWTTLYRTDGVTNYSLSYWKTAYSSEGSSDYFKKATTAIDETLAEIGRLEVIGDDMKNVHPLWMEFYKDVKNGG